ncbi:MAG: zinc ribbon domain-containing protein [Theionarchaea archaeon]|nr:zinc ribbon domain-containing protein [Theionarchaea archaeon]
MKCKNCGREIDNMWGFCSHCGFFSGGLEDSFMNIARMLGGKAVIKKDGDSFIVIIEFQGVRQAFKITPIEIEQEITSQSVAHPPPVSSSSVPPRTYKKTKELTSEINYVGEKLYIKVDIPDISEDDIEIDEMENSIEIRAYEGETRYFKLVPFPEQYRMLSKEYLPGEIIIALEKK